MLPHAYAFASPMFSTGIAWSLAAVERVGRHLQLERSAQPHAPWDPLVVDPRVREVEEHANLDPTTES